MSMRLSDDKLCVHLDCSSASGWALPYNCGDPASGIYVAKQACDEWVLPLYTSEAGTTLVLRCAVAAGIGLAIDARSCRLVYYRKTARAASVRPRM